MKMNDAGNGPIPCLFWLWSQIVKQVRKMDWWIVWFHGQNRQRTDHSLLQHDCRGQEGNA